MTQPVEPFVQVEGSAQADTTMTSEPILSPAPLFSDDGHDSEQRDISLVPQETADATPQEASSVESIEALRHELQIAQSELGEIKTLFIQHIQGNDLNRVAFDRLHKEMQNYKDDFLQRAQEPLYRALIALDDDIDKTIRQERDITPNDCQYLRDVLEEILARQDVVAFHCEQDMFDPARQKAIRTMPTQEPSEHRQILERIRRGYKIGDRVVRPEYVAIRVYTAPREETK